MTRSVAEQPQGVAGSRRRYDDALVRRRWLPVLLTLTVLVRLLGVGAPLTSDEGGYLYLAAQWAPGGSSLYGDYWVDRPPLLIAFFAGADALGGRIALRLLGVVLAVVSVLLAHQVGRGLGGRRGARMAAVLTAAAVSLTPVRRLAGGR